MAQKLLFICLLSLFPHKHKLHKSRDLVLSSYNLDQCLEDVQYVNI